MLLFIFSVFSVWAGIEFNSLRTDATMPIHCVALSATHFSVDRDKVVYGIEGYKKRGFTHEIPLERQEARLLWEAVNGNLQSLHEVQKQADLRDFYDILENEGRVMGFDYGKEGDILEVFALLDLNNEYPIEHFFTTGGYEYRNGHGPTIGELDILVGRRDDCSIIVIGEAKLGYKMLGKAKEQLSRFENFYRNNH